MTTDEEYRRQDAEDREANYPRPDPCGCLWLSACCGRAPTLGSMVTVLGVGAGFCSQCNDPVDFEKSDEDTWKYTGSYVYGDDTDGNRGAQMRTYVCTVCGREAEALGG